MRFYRIYAPFAINSVKRVLAYRFSAIGWALMPLITFFVTYNIWKAIFASSPSDIIAGFTFHQIAVYSCLQVLIQRLTNSSAGWKIGGDVVKGDIASTMIKPISYIARLFAEDLGNKIYNLAATGTSVFIIVYFMLKFPFNPAAFVLFFISLILSALIYFFFDTCFSMLAFYVTYIWGLNVAKFSMVMFLSGTMIPMVFFPESVQTVFKFLPFQYISYTPAMIFLGKYESAEMWFILGVQLFWVAALYGLSKLLWASAIKRLTILGG